MLMQGRVGAGEKALRTSQVRGTKPVNRKLSVDE